MIMKKSKLFRGRLSLNAAGLITSQVDLGAVGINIPVHATTDYRKEFGVDGPLSLGTMWGSLNDPKFYENIGAADVVPKPEDFIEVPFRLLSATTVGAGTWKATDFSDVNMLRGSMGKLDGKPVYKDHETDLDNWVGIVRATKWSEATTQNGMVIPAGIDGLLAIDAKTNPKIARGVLLGSIFSNSVTVEFTWEMSHLYDNEWDFYDNIGKLGSDGKMIRRVAKEITNYHESSLVWLGADPFAKAVAEDGSYKHIDTGSVYSYAKKSVGKEDKTSIADESDAVKNLVKDGKKFTINFALDKNLLPLRLPKTVENLDNGKNDNTMEKFLLAFVSTFGAHFKLNEGDKPTEDQLVGFLKDLGVKSPDTDDKLQMFDKMKSYFKDAEGNAVSDVEAFMSERVIVEKSKIDGIDELDTQITNLTRETERLTPLAKIGEAYSNNKREEAIRLYKAAVGVDKADEAVINLFKKADEAAVDGLLRQYTKNATEKFSGTCSDCGSTNFKFQSSFTKDKDAADEDDLDTVVTTEALRERYSNSSLNIGRTKNQ